MTSSVNYEIIYQREKGNCENETYPNRRNDSKYFKFQYSQEEYEKSLSCLNGFTDINYSRLDEFLRFVDEKELRMKRTEEELNDIREAVEETIDKVSDELIKIDPILEVSRKYAVGSMAEGTRIEDPDEFEFILVLKKVTEDIVTLDKISPMNVYNACKDSRNCHVHEHVPYPIDKKCQDGAEFTHAHLRIYFRRYLKLKLPESWRYVGYICDWKDMINITKSNQLSRTLKLKVRKRTGTLSVKPNEDIDRRAGPDIALKLLWQSNEGKKLAVSLNAVLAVELDEIQNYIEDGSIPCPEYERELTGDGKNHLMPQRGQNKCCFKFTFTPVEVSIIKRMSDSHKLCYKMLKFLFGNYLYEPEMCKSFFLKTLVLRHVSRCRRTASPSRCFVELLKVLNITIKQCKEMNCNYKSYNKIDIENTFISEMVVNNGNPKMEERLLEIIAETLHDTGKSENRENSTLLQHLSTKLETYVDKLFEKERQESQDLQARYLESNLKPSMASGLVAVANRAKSIPYRIRRQIKKKADCSTISGAEAGMFLNFMNDTGILKH